MIHPVMNNKCPALSRHQKKLIYLLVLLCCINAGCSRLKQWAYQGIDRDQWQQSDKVIATLQIPAWR